MAGYLCRFPCVFAKKRGQKFLPSSGWTMCFFGADWKSMFSILIFTLFTDVLMSRRIGCIVRFDKYYFWYYSACGIFFFGRHAVWNWLCLALFFPNNQMSNYSYLLVSIELSLFLAYLTLALFVKKECIREYVIIRRQNTGDRKQEKGDVRRTKRRKWWIIDDS